MPQEGRRAIPQWCRASEAQKIRGIKDSKIAETASHLKNATRRSFGKKSEVIRERYASCKRLIIAGRYSKEGASGVRLPRRKVQKFVTIVMGLLGMHYWGAANNACRMWHCTMKGLHTNRLIGECENGEKRVRIFTEQRLEV